MICRKCGYESEEEFKTCPYCRTRVIEASVVSQINAKEETKINKEEDEKNNSSVKEEKNVLPILLILVVVALGLALFYYNKINDNNNDIEDLTLQEETILKYKSEGYAITDLYDDMSDLDNFSLINNNYEYIDTTELKASTDLFCDKNLSNISVVIENGFVIIKDLDNEIDYTVEEITDAKSITTYHKNGCDCSDFNIVVVTKDGKLFIYESEELINKKSELIKSLLNGFKQLEIKNRVKSVAVTNYVGEVSACTIRALLYLDERNEKYIYINGKIESALAPYSQIIYNVATKDKENYSLYVNPDRTIQIGSNFSDENLYITDLHANKIKYYGILKEESSTEMLFLSTDGYLYTVNFGNNLENITASTVRNLKVINIGYKFDTEEMKSKYIIIYSDGSVRDYTGSFETHGVFSTK